MRLLGLPIAILVIFCSSISCFAQNQPNLENGFKDYGSVHGSSIDSINLTSGNWMLHAPLIPDVGQRGDLSAHYFISVNSKNWQIACKPSKGSPTGMVCNWVPGRTGPVLERSNDISVHRTVDISGSGTGTVTYEGYGYTINTADGASHQVYGLPGTQDANGDPTVYETLDTSGYHLTLTNLDNNGVWEGATVLDRQGNQYSGAFGAYQNCPKPQGNVLPNPGGHAPIIDDAPFGDRYCSQTAFLSQVTDANGNQVSFHGPQNTNAGVDTVGRNQPLENSTQITDYSKCVSRFAITAAYLLNYAGPGGNTQQIEVCYAYVAPQTAFNATAYSTAVSEAPNSQSGTPWQIVTIILADGSTWTFDYDSYLEVTSVGLPTGGTITLTWTTINFSSCNPPDPTYLSRAVASRTLNDNNGHSATWTYSWGTPANGTLVNTATDPLGNDSVHTFTALSNQGSSNGCFFYETRTQDYQGTGGGRQLLKEVDTTYSSLPFSLVTTATSAAGNVVPTSIQTTVYPSGKVNLVTKAYDPGLGANAPIFGNVITEKEYDYGQGSPGSLLRETDTTYQWQVSSAYLTAHMVDLPASVVIKDGSGNRVAETDYSYDEPAYLTTSNISTQHGSNPASVRGNLTTVSKWLNTSSNPVVGHTNWFDTGEAYQAIDPLGHTTTHSYSSTFAGAYPTQTCNALNQCVSGNYDFTTGLLTSFTDANGNTSNYGYDFMSRLTSAQLPADPAGNHPQTTFTYSAPNIFPLTLQRTRSITATMNDVATNYYDGLGRVYRTQHTTPDGNATVDTTYDGLDHIVQVTNPYYSTSDPTYGVIQTQYDALGRPTQVTKQDGSISLAQYDQTAAVSSNGNCTISIDEAGNPRKTCSDGLGRLIEVDEPQATAIGTSATASLTISGALQTLQSGSSIAAATGTPIVMASMDDVYFLGSNQHVYEFFDWRGWWAAFDVTAATGAPAAATGSTLLSSYNSTSGTTSIYYVGSDQHIHRLWCCSSGSWATADLTNVSGGPLAAPGTPIVMASMDDLYYLGSNQHVWELFDWRGPWSTFDATGSTGAPAAATGSTLFSSYNASSGTTSVYYAGSDQHIHRLWCCSSGGWATADLTSLTGGPPAAAGTPIVMASMDDLYYLGSNQHVWELFDWRGPWSTSDATAATGAPAAATGSTLFSSYNASSGTTSVYYAGSDQHIHRLWCCSSGSWATADLTNVTGGPLTATGTPIVMASMDDLYYLGSSQHVWELFDWRGPWSTFDATATTGAPAAVNGSNLLSSYNPARGVTSIYYVGSDQSVHRTWCCEFGNWTTLNLSADAAGAADSGTVSLTLGSFTVTACYGDTESAACAAQTKAYTNMDVAAALAQAINVPGSPATATVSGATINLVWKAPGPFTPGVSGLSTTHDHANLFPNPSFTSPAGSFSGGTAGTLTNPYVTLYQYDALGNLVNVTQEGGTTDSTQWRVRGFTYDSLSRLLTAANPESGTINYSYDAEGNLIQKISPAPNQTGTAIQSVSYCYDQLHRFTDKSYTPQTPVTGQPCTLQGVVVHDAYDAGTNGIGHLTSFTDQAGSGNYSYDALGRVAGESRTIAGIQKSLAYTYNLDSSVATLTYPSGAVVTYTPDSAGRILSAVDNSNNISYATSASYDATGALTSIVRGHSGSFAGITNGFSFNKRLQPVTMSATSPSATVFSIGYDFHLGNGDTGNVYGITNNRDTSRNQTFTYDALNRLISAQNAGTDCTQKTVNNLTEYWGNSYGYDAWGNLLQKTVTKCSAESLSVIAGAANQVHMTSGPDYAYDSAGNMAHDATTGNNYTFDQENRITGAAGYTYTYDADGNRVEKSNGSTGTVYWYMSPGIVAESDLTGALKSEYVFFDGERLARKDFPGNSVFYYFSDHLKTASVITDSAGNIKEDEDFYPWGGELQFVNNDLNHYKFTGKERDSETQLDYFGARYYGNWLGRWLSPDWSSAPVPIPYADLSDPQSFNQYSYVRNIPTTKIDTDGHGIIDPGVWAKINGWVGSQLKEIGKGLANAAVDTANFFHDVLAHGDSPIVDDHIPLPFPNGSTTSKVVEAVAPLLIPGVGEEEEIGLAERELQTAANRAAESVGEGSGAVHGTEVHTAFSKEIKALNDPNIETEISYKNGKVVDRGTQGSVRVDAVVGSKAAPKAIYDLKTGKAKLAPARIQQIRSNLPKGSKNVPIKEIRPQQ